MATETQTASVPEVTILSRVASIPLISSSLESIHSTLSSNTYTRSPYHTAQGLYSSAYDLSAPLQARLAPLIVRADGYANKGLDAVESRYPYPFKAKPEEVKEYVRERRQSASDAATKTIDERVKTPAYTVAQGIDQRFAPIVDYFEVTVNKLNHSSESCPSSPTGKYQYQRALAISLNLKDQIYEYSNEQIKQLQTQNALVQRATETAHSITALASSSLTTAQTRVHTLSDNMLQELQKLQSSLQQSTTSAQSHLPQSLQDSLSHLSTALSGTIHDFGAILKSDKPLQEKVGALVVEVKEGVSPLLGKVGEAVGRGKEEAQKKVRHAQQQTNGHT